MASSRLPNTKSKESHQRFYEACASGNVEVLETFSPKFINSGRLYQDPKSGNYPMGIAILNGRTEIIDFLINFSPRHSSTQPEAFLYNRDGQNVFELAIEHHVKNYCEQVWYDQKHELNTYVGHYFWYAVHHNFEDLAIRLINIPRNIRKLLKVDDTVWEILQGGDWSRFPSDRSRPAIFTKCSLDYFKILINKSMFKLASSVPVTQWLVETHFDNNDGKTEALPLCTKSHEYLARPGDEPPNALSNLNYISALHAEATPADLLSMVPFPENQVLLFFPNYISALTKRTLSLFKIFYEQMLQSTSLPTLEMALRVWAQSPLYSHTKFLLETCHEFLTNNTISEEQFGQIMNIMFAQNLKDQYAYYLLEQALSFPKLTKRVCAFWESNRHTELASYKRQNDYDSEYLPILSAKIVYHVDRFPRKIVEQIIEFEMDYFYETHNLIEPSYAEEAPFNTLERVCRLPNTEWVFMFIAERLTVFEHLCMNDKNCLYYALTTGKTQASQFLINKCHNRIYLLNTIIQVFQEDPGLIPWDQIWCGVYTAENFEEVIDEYRCQICLEFSEFQFQDFTCKKWFHTECIKKWRKFERGDLVTSLAKAECPSCRCVMKCFWETNRHELTYDHREISSAVKKDSIHRICKKCRKIFDTNVSKIQEVSPEESPALRLAEPASLSTESTEWPELTEIYPVARTPEIPPLVERTSCSTQPTDLPLYCTKCQPRFFKCPNCGNELEKNGGCDDFVCCLFGADGCSEQTLQTPCDHGSTENVRFCGHRWVLEKETGEESDRDSETTDYEDYDY